MLLKDFSVVSPHGTNVSHCGYCKSLAGSRTYGMTAHLMTCNDYQKLINHGWRRSGKYIYKPNLRDSCCPQYTIRMKANEFEASKHQRQIVNRFNNYVQEGDENFEKDISSQQDESARAKNQSSGDTQTTLTSVSESAAAADATSTSNDAMVSATTAEGKKQKQKPKKAPKNAATDIKTRIRSSEYLRSPEITSWKHRFRVELEPSSFSTKKYELFAKYQMAVHHEPEYKCRPRNFTNFLVDSPLTRTKDTDWKEEDPGFGSFHQCYYLDETLIAVSVIDILPECVSAVYFFYDPDYSVLSLGKYSAQREIAFAQTLNSQPGYEDLKFYYMGFYIFSCPKMTYKGHFRPSYLLDPETYNWVEFEKCEEIQKGKRYSSYDSPIPVNPLFEAKIQSIVDNRTGAGSYDDGDDDDDDDEEDGDWENIDENEDEENDLDPDDFEDRAVENEDENDGERKRKKLNSEGEQQRSEKKEKKREMERVFREITSLPPPGCLDPKEVTTMDLISVLCLADGSVLRPVVVRRKC
ncbi:arginine-tRNA-protein transferase [Dissophora ornata]|nr:arginine-tRNA-protein transferase [Dissophora ornata]